MTIEENEEMTTPEQSLFDFFQNSPFYGVELELPKRGEISNVTRNIRDYNDIPGISLINPWEFI